MPQKLHLSPASAIASMWC